MAGSPRLIFLTLYYPPIYSGAALQAIALIRALLVRGADVTVLTAFPGSLDRGEGNELTPAGARVVRVRAPRNKLARQVVLGLNASARLLFSSDWDVLHLIGPTYAGLLPVCVARLRRRPVVTKTTLFAGDESGGGVPLLRRVRRWIYRLSDAVVALSEALEREVRAEAGSDLRVVRLPNGVDLDFFRPGSPAERDEARRSFGLREDAFVIACCGEINPRKRAHVLVAAASRMKHQPVQVVLAGPTGRHPDSEAQIDEAIAAGPTPVAVTRMGSLGVERIATLLRGADAFALLSRSEGMPNSLLEAMASGLACVASDIPGSRDVLAHGGGCLFPLDDVQALADTLDELAADSGLRERLGAEARSVVAERFSLDSVATRYLAIYGDLLGRARP